MKRPLSLKQDRFRRSRGGQSRVLQISCVACGTSIIVYQKDGPGILKRAYLDRIMSPERLTGLQNKATSKIKMLICGKCKRVIGVPYVYPKEKRKAFMLERDSFKKKIIRVRP